MNNMALGRRRNQQQTVEEPIVSNHDDFPAALQSINDLTDRLGGAGMDREAIAALLFMGAFGLWNNINSDDSYLTGVVTKALEIALSRFPTGGCPA